MNQLALNIDFDPRRLARASDPITSHEAARRVQEFAPSHCDLILNCLRTHGPCSADEIARLTGALLGYQIRKRLPEMQRAGLVEPTGETRLSASGRPERVWRLRR